MITRKTNRVWTVPVILAIASATGLIAALLADGWADALSWVGLGLPVVVACVYALRAR